MNRRTCGENAALAILAFVAVPAMGFLIGWLSGAGQTLGTAFVLTLLTVLLTLLGFKQVKAALSSGQEASHVVDPGQQGHATPALVPRKRVLEKAIEDLSSDWLSAFLGSVAVCMLTLAWINGVVEGKKPHRAPFPSVSTALETVPVKSPALLSRLSHLRLVMRGKQLESDDFKQFVRDVVAPLVRADKEAEAETQVGWFVDSLAKIDKAASTTSLGSSASTAVKSDSGARDAGGTVEGK